MNIFIWIHIVSESQTLVYFMHTELYDSSLSIIFGLHSLPLKASTPLLLSCGWLNVFLRVYKHIWAGWRNVVQREVNSVALNYTHLFSHSHQGLIYAVTSVCLHMELLLNEQRCKRFRLVFVHIGCILYYLCYYSKVWGRYGSYYY